MEFSAALTAADRVFVTDVYPAREAPIPGVSGALVADGARDMGADVTYVPRRANVVAAVADELRPGDLCVTLGAGDLDVAARELYALRAASEGA